MLSQYLLHWLRFAKIILKSRAITVEHFALEFSLDNNFILTWLVLLATEIKHSRDVLKIIV